MAFDLTREATFQANRRSSHWAGVGCADVTTFMSEAVSTIPSMSCTRAPPSIGRTSSPPW